MASPHSNGYPSPVMAKKSNPNTTLIVLIAGGLVVAGLVGWALTRSVESEVPFVPATASSSPASTSAPSAIQPMSESEKAAVARMAVEDLHAKLGRGEVTVIDVRDLSSYTSGHIPNALHIPLARIEGEIAYLPKDKPIVTYCT